MSPARAAAQPQTLDGAVGHPCLALVEFAPGASRYEDARVYGPERGLAAAARVARSVCDALRRRPPQLMTEPADEAAEVLAFYVTDGAAGPRLARVAGLSEGDFTLGLTALWLGDGVRRRAIHRSLAGAA